MQNFPVQTAEELLVGIETADDASIYRLTENILLVQTLDFFTPVVDDPYLYGQISAANSFSDVYAMGGKPLTALNIVCFPCRLDLSILAEILRGAREKAEEAGVLIVGGHSVEDEVPKFGMSVVGVVEEKSIVRVNGAKKGDYLVLTKPLGIGILATALKGGLISEDDIRGELKSVTQLNKRASEAMIAVGVNAGTDITGFGLLGHLFEMMEASGTSAEVWVNNIPIWPKAQEHAEMGVVPGGAKSNRDALKDQIIADSALEKVWLDILFDPQTSGGLLMSVSPERKKSLLDALSQRGVDTRAVIGRVLKEKPGTIRVIEREE